MPDRATGATTGTSTADPAEASEATPHVTFGRYAEVPADSMPADMRRAYDRTRSLRGTVPGPHKIWLANPTLSETIVPTGAYFQATSTLTKAEIEIVTAVITGHWRCAYATHEHERIGVEQGGLSVTDVDAIMADLPTAFDDPREQIVYELASTLAAGRLVPLVMFERARDLLGDAGIIDVTVLMGWFSAVSFTLNAFDVPSDATGLDQ